jgi:uncharacterized surface protein with fasciclin (FAS1) repeats
MKIKNGYKKFLIAVLLACVFVCCKKSSYDYPDNKVSLYTILAEDNPTYSLFKYAVDLAGLKDTLSNGNFTLFAPNNAAMSSAGVTTATMYAMSKDSLSTWVKNHMVAGMINASGLTDGQVLNAISGLPILVQKKNGATYLNGSDLSRTEIGATNGVLNIITGTFINRPSILDRVNSYVIGTSNSQLTFLAAAIVRASQGSTNFVSMLSDPLQEYTLFAPNNGAFIDAGYGSVATISAANPDVLGTLLKAHIVSGRKLSPDLADSLTSLSGGKIYFDKEKSAAYAVTNEYANGLIFNGGDANMLAGKGVVHIVPRMLSTPLTVNTLTKIQSDTSLTFFNAALIRAGQSGTDFVKMLSSPDSTFTVFAVNNNGFRAAGYASLNDVNNAVPQLLADMLKYHLVRNRINNFSVATTADVPTLFFSVNPTNNQLVNNVVRFISTISSNSTFKVQGNSNTTGISISKTNANIVTTNGLLNIIGTMLQP